MTKLAPAMLLGPKCNHDLDIILHLPGLSQILQEMLIQDYMNSTPNVQSEHDRQMQRHCEAAAGKLAGINTESLE